MECFETEDIFDINNRKEKASELVHEGHIHAFTLVRHGIDKEGKSRQITGSST